MAPSEFDSFIRQKVREAGNVHEKESGSARAGIWNIVQKRTHSRNTFKWYHLAAALLLLFIAFAILMIQNERAYELELNVIATRMSEMEKQYAITREKMQGKDAEISELNTEVSLLKSKLADLQANSAPSEMKRQTVIQKDTVYISKIEYIEVPVRDTVILIADSKEDNLVSNEKQTDSTLLQWDNEIFPPPASAMKTQNDESIRIRFGKLQAATN